MRRCVLACLLACLAGSSPAIEPPGWWNDANPGTAELIYRKGSAEKCASEQEARLAAWNNGLATIRMGITPDTNLWRVLQMSGTDIAFEDVRRDPANGTWYAWVLVSYPKEMLGKALKRAEEITVKAQERTPVFVCPLSFGKESAEQFPDVVKKYKSLGYGNAIWQTVEDMLYDKGFETVTAPTNQTKSMLEQMLGQSAVPAGTTKLPDKILLCNMNFFEVKTEKLSMGSLARNSEYHAELMLELYDVKGAHSNVKIPAKGEAKDKDLLTAVQSAARQAVEKLVGRMGKP